MVSKNVKKLIQITENFDDKSDFFTQKNRFYF